MLRDMQAQPVSRCSQVILRWNSLQKVIAMSLNVPPTGVTGSTQTPKDNPPATQAAVSAPVNTPKMATDHVQLNAPPQGSVSQTFDFIDPPPQKKSNWELTFSASHSFTTYFDTDMHLTSSRVNVDIDDFAIKERGSRDFFNPKNWEQPMDAARWIDEPTNTFALTLEKNKNQFTFSAFHPKFLFDNEQIKHIKGTVDGVAVDHVDYVSKPFDGYNQEPGELEIAQFRNTHRQMEYEVGYGREMTLVENPKLGRLTYTPGVSAGVMVGQTHTEMIKEGQWWEYDSADDKSGIQGFGGSVRNKLAWETPNGRFSVFGENKTSLYKLEHGFMDGKAKYNLGYTSTAVGMSVRIYKPKP